MYDTIYGTQTPTDTDGHRRTPTPTADNDVLIFLTIWSEFWQSIDSIIHNSQFFGKIILLLYLSYFMVPSPSQFCCKIIYNIIVTILVVCMYGTREVFTVHTDGHRHYTTSTPTDTDDILIFLRHWGWGKFGTDANSIRIQLIIL